MLLAASSDDFYGDVADICAILGVIMSRGS